MPQRALLPRSAPAASGVSSPAISALLDRLDEKSVECHSLMVVHHGHVVAEGWWTPYSADRPHLLYSLTKSFTSIAVGLAIADGLLSLDDRVVDVLPDHVPAHISQQGRRISVHHLLSMTAGHRTDSLAEAWRSERNRQFEPSSSSPLHPLAALLIIVLMDVDVAIPKVFVQIIRPVARALAVGSGHEVYPGQRVGIFFALGDVYFRCERGGL